MTVQGYSLTELMIIEGSRHLDDGLVVFIGTGLPMAACLLAQMTHASNLIAIAETGPVAPTIVPGPMGVGDPRMWHKAMRMGSILDVLGAVLQRGMCDVGFLGGVQIDPYGNLNSTLIGNASNPKVRLVGSGGAADLGACARRILVITKHEKRRFVPKCDYITTPGFLDGPGARERAGLTGGGPYKIITDLCVMGFHPRTRRMMVEKLHPGVTLQTVRDHTGFELEASEKIETTRVPSEEELSVLRERIDPNGVYLKD